MGRVAQEGAGGPASSPWAPCSPHGAGAGSNQPRGASVLKPPWSPRDSECAPHFLSALSRLAKPNPGGPGLSAQGWGPASSQVSLALGSGSLLTPRPLTSAPTLWAVPLGLQCAGQFWVTLSWLEPPTAARTRPDSLFPEGRAVAGPLGSWTSPEPGVIPGWTFPDPHPRPSLASTRDTDLGTHSPPSATRCSPLCFVIITDGETEAGSHGQGGQSWRPGVRLHPDMLVPHLQSRIKHVGGGGLGMGGRGGPRFSLAVAREQHRPR